VGTPPSGDEPRRPRRLWLRISVAVLVLIAAGVAMRYFFNQRQAQSRLQRIIDDLDASDLGWRLEEIEQARAVVPDAENSARLVVAVRRRLPGNWPPQPLFAALQGVEPQEQLRLEFLALLADELDRLTPALHEARKLADRPRGRYPITYAPNPINTLLDQQQQSRLVSALLAYDARRLAQEGDPKAALASCRAALNAGRSLGDEPTGISQLVRTAGVAVGCGEIERVLAQSEPAEDDLALVQRLLLEEDRFPTLLVLLRGERAMGNRLFEGVAKGEVRLGDAGSTPAPPPGLMDSIGGWLERRHFGPEHPLQLETMTGRVKVARLPLHEQPAAMKDRAIEEDRDLPSGAVMTRLLLPALDKLCQASWRKHAQVRSLAVLVAVERFRKANGRWPDRLDELTPRFLAAVPLDPYDGKPLRYRRLGDGVVVYSVGPDETDNGGTLDRRQPTRAGADLGYRLWDVARRRQPARPAPAR
jgi:hypothetical protein